MQDLTTRAGKRLGSKKKSSPRNTPELIDGLTGIIAISSMATDGARFVALKKDRTVWSLGNNFCGALGNGTNKDLDVPAQASGLEGVVAISAGRGHTLALKKDGTVAAWGSNRYEQLGDGTGLDRNVPVLVKSPGTAVTEPDEAFARQLKVLNKQLRNHGTGSWNDEINVSSLSESQLEFLKELLHTREDRSALPNKSNAGQG